MCNAWNHGFNCTCGWGDGWRMPSNAAKVFSNKALSYESFTTPYAHCPVCGTSVFFYRSPNGGGVFFDSLGPPWPKHPCTDNGSTPSSVVSILKVDTTTMLNDSPIRSWKASGWHPYLVSQIFDYNPQLLRISGTIAGEYIELYLRKKCVPGLPNLRLYIQGSLVQSRRKSDEVIALSILGPDFRPVTVDAFMSSIFAENSKIEFLRPRNEGEFKRSFK